MGGMAGCVRAAGEEERHEHAPMSTQPLGDDEHVVLLLLLLLLSRAQAVNASAADKVAGAVPSKQGPCHLTP